MAARVEIADSPAKTGSDPAELMPDEPSGALAVIVLTALGSVIVAGLVTLLIRWLA